MSQTRTTPDKTDVEEVAVSLCVKSKKIGFIAFLIFYYYNFIMNRNGLLLLLLYILLTLLFVQFLNSKSKDFYIDLNKNNWTITHEESGITKKEQKLPIIPNRIFNIPVGKKLNYFFIETKFYLDKSEFPENKAIGIHFSYIGENYEIFLNNKSILKEIYIENGKIIKNKVIEGLYIIPDSHLFVDGENTLSIRLIGGSPFSFLELNNHLGLAFSIGYFIACHDYILSYNLKYFDLAINAAYFLFGLFYIFVFIRLGRGYEILYFGLFAIDLAIYLFHRTYIIYYYYDDYILKMIIEYLSLFLLTPLVFFFFYHLLGLNKTFYNIGKISIIHSAIISFSMLVTDKHYMRTYLTIWQATAFIFLIYIVINLVYYGIKNKGNAAYILIASLIFSFSAFWDIIDAVFSNTGIRLAQFGFFTLMLTLLIILANNLLNMQIMIDNQRKAFFKYVPLEFVELLKKDSIIDVNLGDHILENVAILFADIRSFTALSESMSPEENFNFLNSYLKRVSPIIRENNGIIDKYVGDGIIAIFPGGANDALDTAIKMQKEVKKYNHDRVKSGYRTIEIGIGLHIGNSMIGIIGEDERYNGTVISDTVNLTSRLESLTKKYKAKIIVSKDIIKHLKNSEKYNYRYLDYVIVKGKSKAVKIYEVFDADSKEMLRVKKECKEQFESAVNDYVDNKFSQAGRKFKKLIRNSVDDTTLEAFIKMIKKKKH